MLTPVNPCLQHVGLPNSLLKDQRSMWIVHFLKAKPGNEAPFLEHTKYAKPPCLATKYAKLLPSPCISAFVLTNSQNVDEQKRHFELTKTKFYRFTLLTFWSFIEIIEHHHTAVMLRNVFKCPRCLGCICPGKNPCQHLAWQTRIVGPSAECFTSLRKAYAVLQAQRLGERIS